MLHTKRLLALLLAAVMTLGLFACGTQPVQTAAEEKTDAFPTWNECEALTALKGYVEDVTDEQSANFIPVADRIAVFDMDGTLCGELFPTYLEYLLCAYRCLDDPDYQADPELQQIAQVIREGSKADGTGSFPKDMALQHAYAQAKAFAGLTPEEFDAYVKKFLDRDADGFRNMKYADSLYVPMTEVVAYLQENGFTTYVVSGSDRFICRAVACEKLNIPYEHVIGMDVSLRATGQGDEAGVDYQYQTSDKVVRGDRLLVKNLKMNKVAQIVQEIGRQPVLSFGNSSGDTSMHLYTITDNKYKSAAFMLIADDEERDYGNTEKNTKKGEDWKNMGFHVISMKDDFKTIYGYDVVKTELTYNG